MRAYLLNPPSPKPMIREGRCQSPGNMRKTSIPQLSLAYIATSLRAQGSSPRLLDAVAEGADLAAVLADIREWGSQAVWMNTTTPTIDNDLAVATALKGALPQVRIILFGAHVTAVHRELLEQSPQVDAVIRGEPEPASAECAGAIDSGKDFRGIAGLTYRCDGEVVVEHDRKLERELARLGWPARDLLPNHLYVHPVANKRYTTVNVGRGCPQRCIFCVAPVYYGKPIRVRPVDDVLDEIEQDVIGRHGIDHCWFYADDLTANKKFLGALCEGILSRGLDIHWWGNTRADVQDAELYKLMGRSGCMMLSIGAESASEEVLRRARKNIVPDDIRITVEQLREARILSLAYFLIGLPGETRETIRETVRFAKKVRPDFVEFYPATPYPGTEFGEIAEREGLIVNRDLSQYECGGTQFVVQVPGMTPQELQKALHWAYRSFYLSPRAIPSLLRRFRTPSGLMSLARFGLGYFKRLRTRVG
ncbi:MAG: radical SAM protein [Planctomycetota bacterium]